MEPWTPIEPKDQEQIWDVAMAILARREITLTEALQAACAEFYGAHSALRRGIKFYVVKDGEQQLRRVRELENGTWVNERAQRSSSSKQEG